MKNVSRDSKRRTNAEAEAEEGRSGEAGNRWCNEGEKWRRVLERWSSKEVDKRSIEK